MRRQSTRRRYIAGIEKDDGTQRLHARRDGVSQFDDWICRCIHRVFIEVTGFVSLRVVGDDIVCASG